MWTVVNLQAEPEWHNAVPTSRIDPVVGAWQTLSTERSVIAQV